MPMARLIQEAAKGQIVQRDWQIIDAVMFKACSSMYAVEKQTGIHRQEVKRRLAKIGLAIN